MIPLAINHGAAVFVLIASLVTAWMAQIFRVVVCHNEANHYSARFSRSRRRQEQPWHKTIRAVHPSCNKSVA
jgi:hypothetical protein